NRKQRPIRRRQRGGASPTGRTPAGRSSKGSRGEAPPRGSQKRAFLEPIPCNAPRSGFMIMRRIDRGVLARAVGRGAPRPHCFRRMAPALKHGRRRRINIRLGHSLRQSALARRGAVTGAPLVLSSKQHPVLESLGGATNLTAVRK